MNANERPLPVDRGRRESKQLQAMFIKIGLTKFRNKLSTVMEYYFPFIFFGFIIMPLTRNIYPTKIFPETRIFGGELAPISPSGNVSYSPLVPALLCPSSPLRDGSCFYSTEGYAPPWKEVYIYPSDADLVNLVMLAVSRAFHPFLPPSPSVLPALSFSDKSELNRKIETSEGSKAIAFIFDDEFTSSIKPKLFLQTGGGGGGERLVLNVTMRMGGVSSDVDGVDGVTSCRPYFQEFSLDSNEAWKPFLYQYKPMTYLPTPCQSYGYLSSRFVALQSALAESFLNATFPDPKDQPLNFLSFSVKQLSFRTEAEKLGLGRSAFAACLVPIGIMMFTQALINQLVSEKESGMRSALLIMGVPSWIYWFSWLIVYIMFQYSVVFFFQYVFLLADERAIYRTAYFLSVDILLLNATANIAMSVFLATILQKRQSTSTIGVYLCGITIIVFMTVSLGSSPLTAAAPSASISAPIDFRSDTPPVLFLVSLFPPVAMSIIISNMWAFEVGWGGTRGLNGGEMIIPGPLGMSTLNASTMLAIDTALFFLISWYCSHLFPPPGEKQYPPFFFLTASYWREFFSVGRSSPPELPQPLEEEVKKAGKWREMPTQVSGGAGAESTQNLTQVGMWIDENGCVRERRREDSVWGDGGFGGKKRPTVAIRGLSKTYESGVFKKKSVTALSELTLDLYEGEITALLGINGAGKSTAISALIGLTPPTSGTATIYGYDCATEMDRIRDLMGVCLQHDVLVNELTVIEHCTMYGRVRGIKEVGVEREVEILLSDVGLYEKKDEKAGNLSGGQRRKLSVAIAFLGRPKFVILDEPSAGVDPISRRQIWAFVEKHRKGKTILLTTHFMDEADRLATTKAILSGGRLRCEGSSLFLKRYFALSYRLVLVLGKKQQQQQQQQEHQEDGGGGGGASKRKSGGGSGRKKRVKEMVLRFIDNAEEEVRGGASNNGNNINNNNSAGSWRPGRQGSGDVEGVGAKEMVFRLPANRTSDFSPLFRALEESGDVVSLGLSMPGLEEVFLRVAYEAEHAPQDKNISHDKTDRSEFDIESGEKLSTNNKEGKELEHSSSSSVSSSSSSVDSDLQSLVRNMEGGGGGGSRRNRRSRFHDELAIIKTQYIILITAWLKCLFRTIGPSIGLLLISSTLSVIGIYLSSSSSGRITPPPPSPVIPLSPDSALSPLFPPPSSSNRILFATGANSPPALSSLISQNLSSSNLAFECWKNVIPAVLGGGGGDGNGCGFAGMDNLLPLAYAPSLSKMSIISMVVLFDEFDIVNRRFNMTYLFDPRIIHSLPTAIAAVNNAIMNAISTVLNTPLSPPLLTFSSIPISPYSGDGASLPPPPPFNEGIVFFIIALAAIPALFGSEVVEERESGRDHLLSLLLTRAPALWLSRITRHLLVYFTGIAFVLVILLIASIPPYGTEAAAALALVWMLGAVSNTLFAYHLSFNFSTADSCLQMLVIFVLALALIPNIIIQFLVYYGLPVSSLVTAHAILCIIVPPYGMFAVLIFFQSIYNEVVWYNRTPSVMLYLTDKMTMMTIIIYSIQAVFLFLAVCVRNREEGFSLSAVLLEYFPQLSKYIKISKKREGADFVVPPLQESEDDETTSVTREIKRARSALNQKSSNILPAGEGEASRAETEDIVSGISLRKVYRDETEMREFVAVQDVTLGIQPAECLGLLGPNGAGKTTTIKMLTGAVIPTRGFARVGGVDPVKFTKGTECIGFCPQFDALWKDLTVFDHLMLVASLRGLSLKVAEQASLSQLSALHLESFRDRRISECSGGTKRKCQIAMALLGNPPAVILDEPSAGVDVGTRHHMWSVIRQAVSNNGALLLTTHSMEEADALCSRIAIITDGEMKCVGTPQELKHLFAYNYTLEIIYGTATSGDCHVLVQKSLNGYLVSSVGNRGTYSLPDPLPLSRMFEILEEARARMGFQEYSLSQPTMEQVYLNIAGGQAGAGERARRIPTWDERLLKCCFPATK